MKNNEKAVIAGAGALLAYLYLKENKKKNRYLRYSHISNGIF